jgi:opine dehydrogenase
MKVAVVGAGVGGLAVAGHAGLLGFDVAVHDVRPEAVDVIREQGGIEVRGLEDGFAPVTVAATDIEPVARDADLVVIVTQGPDQRAATEALAPHLAPKAVLLLTPGGTLGAVEASSVLEGLGRYGWAVAETDSFAYGCSIPEPGISQITSVKSRIGVAVLGSDRGEEVFDRVRMLFSQAELAPSVLHTGLSNMNVILHLSPMVLNSGRIDLGMSFDFYGEGITPSVARTLDATDSERLAVAGALGVEVPSFGEWARFTYGVDDEDTYQVIQRLHSEVYGPSPAPGRLLHRYLTEDVPCGAVPIVGLGQLIGVDTPVMAAAVALTDVLCGTTWASDGRTMEQLGLSGLSAAELRRRFLTD